MSYEEYLEYLRQYLHQLPKDEAHKIIEEYRQYFKDNLLRGKTEEEIMRELGNPRSLSKKFIEASDVPKRNAVKSKNFIIGIAKASISLIVVMSVVIGIILLLQDLL